MNEVDYERSYRCPKVLYRRPLPGLLSMLSVLSVLGTLSTLISDVPPRDCAFPVIDTPSLLSPAGSSIWSIRNNTPIKICYESLLVGCRDARWFLGKEYRKMSMGTLAPRCLVLHTELINVLEQSRSDYLRMYRYDRERS